MEFCDVCDNLLFLRSDDASGALVKYCKHCPFTKTEEGNGRRAIKVSQTIYSEDDLLYLQFKNKYLRNDPTLPRIRDPSLPCPNRECVGSGEAASSSSETRAGPQVLYVKYHPVHMKYLYCCDYCGTMWRGNAHEKMM